MIYAVSLMAAQATKISHAVGEVMASSASDAQAWAWMECHAMYPTDAGWGNHQAAIKLIRQEWIDAEASHNKTA